MVLRNKIILLFSFIFFVQISVFAQKKSSWTNWEKLYSDKQITVEIRFKIRNNSCSQGGKNSKYKYKITGTLYSSEKYVYWKMKYKACNNITVVKQNQIAIGGSNAETGTIESMDYIFLPKKMIKKFYDADTQKSQPNNKKHNTNSDKKSYRIAKKEIQKTIPYKYCLKFGGGLYTDLGLIEDISFDNITERFYDPYISFGLFRKVGVKPKFTRKRSRDISRATLIGVFADASLYGIGAIRAFDNNFNIKTDGFLRLEAGFHFWEAVRLSAGIIDFGIDSNFDNYLYSGTFGLTLKIRKMHFDINYIQLLNKSFDSYSSYFQIGINFYLNFFRTMPKNTKRNLKNKYGI